MQQASDCDIVVAHDDDLVTINGLGHDAVSGLSNYLLHCPLMWAVAGNPRIRHDD